MFTVWEERTSARAFNRGCRIDFAFVSPGLLPYVHSCEVLTTQHIPPKCEWPPRVQPQSRGPQGWGS